MTREQFNEAFERICNITNTQTQIELATFFGIRQSSISDAKRRGAIPDGWLLELVNRKGINPQWILHGVEPKQLGGAPEAMHKKGRENIIGDLWELEETKDEPMVNPEYLSDVNLRHIPLESLIAEISRRMPRAEVMFR